MNNRSINEINNLRAFFYKLCSPPIHDNKKNKFLIIMINKKKCGISSIETCEILQQHGLGYINGTNLHIGNENISVKDLGELLLNATKILKSEYKIKKWNNELLDIIGPNYEILGYIERSAARILGFKTRSVHMNSWLNNKELWVSKRSHKKTIDPGKLETIVGGLVSKGEKPEQALTRECYEEANLIERNILASSKLSRIFNIKKNTEEGYQIEELLSKTSLLKESFYPKNNDGEVAIFKKMRIEEITPEILSDSFTIESSIIILSDIIKLMTIRNYLNIS
ncbi:NUDIX-family hydrolase [Candidatus Kinetoplastibacterium blastocrithidii TCC012E]|uniref:NUDIX-family hydrolase n=1 Tax=Candidatus Kinetoplastidibacterium blastocrithidiae TCC012E TaxID=1208922 RepID=M1LAF7_9PROT|nr:NUDIX domain-containing protein [Candidatus Kinetoplastibacterium blastocrithidii]AFZ83390.1 NUDIX hydrolase [Candidatus Kinetoplastibacterium blastocrithidii (ex Strigomonas culicis)]AGF49488.1 NUDIX-family hydrolase [Candidatus Kinetoplastibacterium blastocrithidii TCC012E]